MRHLLGNVEPPAVDAIARITVAVGVHPTTGHRRRCDPGGSREASPCSGLFRKAGSSSNPAQPSHSNGSHDRTREPVRERVIRRLAPSRPGRRDGRAPTWLNTPSRITRNPRAFAASQGLEEDGDRSPTRSRCSGSPRSFSGRWSVKSLRAPAPKCSSTCGDSPSRRTCGASPPGTPDSDRSRRRRVP